MILSGNSSDLGGIDKESSIKPACKLLSLSIFTSDGHPMLPDRFFSQEDETSDRLLY